MRKDLFIKIQAMLEAKIAACRLYLDPVRTTEDLRKLTIEQAQTLQRFCRQEEATMTKFVQGDLYHIIGMANLTPPQMMKLTYLTRDWLQYRGNIKSLAMNFDKISQLPKLPTSMAYKIKTVDLTLTSNLEAFISSEQGNVPYAVSGNLIQVLERDLARFLEFWSEKAKVCFTENNFLQKLKAGAEYGGVRWTVDNTGNYVGVIKQPNVQQLFDGCAQ